MGGRQHRFLESAKRRKFSGPGKLNLAKLCDLNPPPPKLPLRVNEDVNHETDLVTSFPHSSGRVMEL